MKITIKSTLYPYQFEALQEAISHMKSALKMTAYAPHEFYTYSTKCGCLLGTMTYSELLSSDKHSLPLPRRIEAIRKNVSSTNTLLLMTNIKATPPADFKHWLEQENEPEDYEWYAPQDSLFMTLSNMSDFWPEYVNKNQDDEYDPRIEIIQALEEALDNAEKYERLWQ